MRLIPPHVVVSRSELVPPRNDEVGTGSVVDFGVLGPLYVRVGESVLAVSSPKLRTLLAALLLNAGEIVTTRTLAHMIWEHAQPENPRRAVQVYIARLRALFPGSLSGQLIFTDTSGYRVDIAPSQLDLARFHDCMRRADVATDQGDVDGEANALAAALRQWRGEPLADVPSETLRLEAMPRLREAHLRARERYFDIQLRRGEHADLVSDLYVLTAQNPGRERLWVQLLKALHSSGRRVEALDAYHTMRRRLATDSGLDPGEELRSIYAAILHGCDDLDGQRPPAPHTPRQVPPGVRGFAGRVDEIAQLDGLVASLSETDVPVVAVIAGTAGVGKTSLAAIWARRVADHFPDGQLWIDLHGFDKSQPVAPEQSLTRLLRALGVPGLEIPLDVTDQLGLWRSMMDGRRMLLVLDNASGPDQVRPLLPGAPRCFVLVTSRNQFAGLVAVEGAHLLNLDLLSRDEARQMLTYRLGVDRATNEPAAIDAIIDLSARLPLALAIVAARAATYHRFGLTAVASDLRTTQGLDRFAKPAATVDIRATFSWSYRALSRGAATMFRHLGLHPGPDIAPRAAASLMGVPVAEVRPALAELCDAHLLTEHAQGRYQFHDLLRTYAEELAQSGETLPTRRTATHRMFDHYLQAAHSAAVLLGPRPDTVALPRPHARVSTEALGDHRDAMAWFTAEHNILLATITRTATPPVYTGHLAAAMSEYLARRGLWRDWIATQQAAVDAATRDDDTAARARAHRGLARAYYRLRRIRAAATHCQLALTLSEQLGERSGQAHSHLGLGAISELQGHKRKAHQHSRTALALFTEVDDTTWMARSLNHVGWSYFLLGDDEQAVAYCQRALALGHEAGDRYGQASTLDSLGRAYSHLRRHSDAALCYQRAIDLHREFGDRLHEGLGLAHLGDSHHAATHHGQAHTAWQAALTILTELHHPDVNNVRKKLAERKPADAPGSAELVLR